MAPRGEEEMSWDWVRSLEPDQLGSADLDRLGSFLVEHDLPKDNETSLDNDDNEETDNEQLEKATSSKLTHLYHLSLRHLHSRLTEAVTKSAKDEESKKELKGQLKRLKKEASSAARSGGRDKYMEDLRAVELEKEELSRAVMELEQENEEERKAKESLEATVANLERERKELQRETQSLREAVHEHQPSVGASHVDLEEELGGYERRVRELEETIRVKNKQIHALLDDVEDVEQHSRVYQAKTTELRDKLADATHTIQTMTEEFVSHEQELKARRAEVESLKYERDEQMRIASDAVHVLDKANAERANMAKELELRTEALSAALEAKERELLELREKLASTLTMATTNTSALTSSNDNQECMPSLSRALREREETIDQLREQLIQATKDLERSSELLERSRVPHDKPLVGDSTLRLQSELQESERRLSDMELSLREAEEIAKEKNEELSRLVAKMRLYEKNVYGLEEAVKEVEALQHQGRLKDRRIDELIQECDSLEFKLSEVQEANDDLREKLGLSSSSGSPNSSKTTLVNTNRKKERALMQLLHKEIQRLEEERLTLKLENREMAKKVGEGNIHFIDKSNKEDNVRLDDFFQSLRGDLNLTHNPKEELRSLHTRNATLMKENNDLRLGMHEILDSIRSEDGHSDVHISCPVLEQVINALDARHLDQDEMRFVELKARVDKLEGANQELRNQVRAGRLNEDDLVAKTIRLKLELQKLSQISPVDTQSTHDHLQQETSKPKVDETSELNKEVREEDQALKTPEDNTDDECRQFILKATNELMNENHVEDDGAVSLEKIDEVNEVKDESNDEINDEDEEERSVGMAARLHTLESFYQTLQQGDEGDLRGRLADSTCKLALLKSNEAVLTRRYRLLEQSTRLCKMDLVSKRQVVNELRAHIVRQDFRHRRTEKNLQFLMHQMDEQLRLCVPKSRLTDSERLLNELTWKYNRLITSIMAMSSVTPCEESTNLCSEVQGTISQLDKKQDPSFLNDNELKSAVKSLSVLELREQTERRNNEATRDQLSIMERQLRLLKDDFELLSQSHLQLQETKFGTFLTADQQEEKEKSSKDLELKVAVLENERSKLKEVNEVVLLQLKYFEQNSKTNNEHMEDCKDLLADSNTHSDQAMLISQLNAQINYQKDKEKEDGEQLKLLKASNASLHTHVYRLQGQLHERQLGQFQMRSAFERREHQLMEVLQYMHVHYGHCLPLYTRERWSEMRLELRQKSEHIDALRSDLNKERLETGMKAGGEAGVQDDRLRLLRAERELEMQREENAHLISNCDRYLNTIENMESKIIDMESKWHMAIIEKSNVFENKDDEPIVDTKKDDSENNKRNDDLHDLDLDVHEVEVVKASAEKQERHLKAQIDRLRSELKMKENEVLTLNQQLLQSSSSTSSSSSSPRTSALMMSSSPEEALQLARASIEGLRRRLSLREETVSRYEHLLQELREQHSMELRHMKSEMDTLNSAMLAQNRVQHTLHIDHDLEHQLPDLAARQANHIHELETQIKELHNSLADISTQLNVARGEKERLRSLVDQTQRHNEEMRRDNETKIKSLDNEHKRRVEQLQLQIDRLNETNTITTTKPNTLKATSSNALVSDVVEKLMAELELKDRKLARLTHNLDELKATEMENYVAKSSELDTTMPKPKSDALLTELREKNLKLVRQLTNVRRQEQQLRADHRESVEEMERLRHRLRERHEESNRVRELQSTVQRLEHRLQNLNKAERPLEEEEDDSGLHSTSQRRQQVEVSKEQQEMVAVAKWEERKRMENKVNILKKKWEEAINQMDKLTANDIRLRELVNKLEREKSNLHSKINRMKILKDENNEQIILIAQLKANIQRLENTNEEPEGVATLKLKNNVLQDRCESLERRLKVLETVKQHLPNASKVLEELERLQHTESELKSKNGKLEGLVTDLKVRLDQTWLSSQMRVVNEARSTLDEIVASIKKLDNVDIREGMLAKLNRLQTTLSTIKETEMPKEERKGLAKSRTSSKVMMAKVSTRKEMEELIAEVDKLRAMNKDLISTLERERSSVSKSSSKPLVSSSSEASKVTLLESDVRRKTELLNEVKTLLKNAAQRERDQLEQIDELRQQVKILVNVDVKTPSEQLAKELRQSKLLIHNLEHKVEKKKGQPKSDVSTN